MKKISRMVGLCGAAFFLGLGLSFSEKTKPSNYDNNISNNVVGEISQHEENSQNEEYENKNDTQNIEHEYENDTIEKENNKNDILDNNEENKNDILDNNEENKNDIEKSDLIINSGIFEGFADDNSVEVNNNGTYNVFRIEDDSIRNILRNKEMGLEINFKYIEKDNSKIIIEIN